MASTEKAGDLRETCEEKTILARGKAF